MRGLVGLGLSVVAGFLFVAATPRGAESGLKARGFNGKVTIQNRRFFTTDLFFTSALVGGNEMFFGARFPPRSTITITGLEQFRSYDFDADYDLDGNLDDNLEIFLAKKGKVFVFDL